MASDNQKRRADELNSEAAECIASGKIAEASRLAREAISISPDDQAAQELLRTLQGQISNSQLLELFKSFVSDGDEQAGKKAVQLLKQRIPVSDTDAEQCAGLLLDSHGPDSELLNDLTTAFFTNISAARKALATHFTTQATSIYGQLQHRGEGSLGALKSTVLDKTAWKSPDERKDAVRELFRLALGTVSDSSQGAEPAMTTVATLLAVESQHLTDMTDENTFDSILSSLDIRKPTPLRSQATLATIKLLEITKEEGEQKLTAYITTRAARNQSEDLIVAFSVAASVFPIVPAVVAALFLVDGFLQGLIPNLQRNSRKPSDQ